MFVIKALFSLVFVDGNVVVLFSLILYFSLFFHVFFLWRCINLEGMKQARGGQ